MAELTATVEKQPNQTTIRISGYLSGDHAESLETAFAELDSKKVLLDFDEKCFINSAGLAVLFDLLLPLRVRAQSFASCIRPRSHLDMERCGLHLDAERTENRKSGFPQDNNCHLKTAGTE